MITLHVELKSKRRLLEYKAVLSIVVRSNKKFIASVKSKDNCK